MRNLAISADGETLYAVAPASETVAIYSRDGETGGLTPRPAPGGCIAESEPDICGALNELMIKRAFDNRYAEIEAIRQLRWQGRSPAIIRFQGVPALVATFWLNPRGRFAVFPAHSPPPLGHRPRRRVSRFAAVAAPSR